MGFIPDRRIEAEATEAAAEMIERARRNFDVALDFTDASIRKVEALLQQLHLRARNDKPSDAQVFDYAKGLGSYVGEVFRRNHGAEWGVVALGDDSYPGMRSTHREQLFWPWRRAYNRIVNGPEDNVWHYYQLLVERAGGTLAVHDDGMPSNFAPPTMNYGRARAAATAKGSPSVRFSANAMGGAPGRAKRPATSAAPAPVRKPWWKFW